MDSSSKFLNILIVILSGDFVMAYSFKRRMADYVSDHPNMNRQALIIYQSLQEVLRLINPQENEHTKKRNQNKKH